LGADVLAITLHERGVRRSDPPGKYQLRLLEASTGTELARIEVDHAFVAAAGNRLYGYSADPYPRLLVYRLSR
jgi:hypothetical protein